MIRFGALAEHSDLTATDISVSLGSILLSCRLLIPKLPVRAFLCANDLVRALRTVESMHRVAAEHSVAICKAKAAAAPCGACKIGPYQLT